MLMWRDPPAIISDSDSEEEEEVYWDVHESVEEIVEDKLKAVAERDALQGINLQVKIRIFTLIEENDVLAEAVQRAPVIADADIEVNHWRVLLRGAVSRLARQRAENESILKRNLKWRDLLEREQEKRWGAELRVQRLETQVQNLKSEVEQNNFIIDKYSNSSWWFCWWW